MLTKINTDNIFVIDNFIPEFLFRQVQFDFGPQFDWRLSHYAYKGGNIVFGQTLFENDVNHYKVQNFPWTVSLLEAFIRQTMVSADPTWEISNILRIRANGQMPTQPANVHKDFWPSGDPKHWSFLYYISESDGDTFFYEEDPVEDSSAVPVTKIEYKPNRGVLFPSHYYHIGSVPSKEFRISLNFLFETNKIVE